MGSAVVWLCLLFLPQLWISYSEKDGTVALLGIPFHTSARAGEFGHFVDSLYFGVRHAQDLIYIAFAVVCYGPKRLWQSSTAIHPLRLANYVLGGFGAVYLIGFLFYVCYIYPGDVYREGHQTVWQIVHATVITCILEEILFRLTLFQVIRARLGFFEAALISSVVFGLLHISHNDPMKALPGCAVGMILAWSYEKTGSILAPLGIHVLNNAWVQFVG
ncbi:MAG: CPBP family intramembrane glutamic endopeptidase [Opitutaceae bacterium]